MALVVVIPVCSDDEDLCYTTQSLARLFGGRHPFSCLVVTAQDRPLANAEKLLALLEETYTGVSRLIIPDRGAKRPWPIPQNQMFSAVARYMYDDLRGIYDSFFYMEPDVWPLRTGWLQDVYNAHISSGRPHTGAVVGMPWDATIYPHLNGAAIYSTKLLALAPRALLAYDSPWDISARDYIYPEANDISKTLQHHSFRSHSYWGSLSVLTYTQEYSKATRDPKRPKDIKREDFTVTKTVDLSGFAVLHGCKDKSLLDVLLPQLSVVPEPEPLSDFDPLPEMIEEAFTGEPECPLIELATTPIDGTLIPLHTVPAIPTPTKKRKARRR